MSVDAKQSRGRVQSRPLAGVVGEFRRHLHFPDPVPLYVVLAAVLANRMQQGEPVWLVLVGGSSRGKTELLAALIELEYVRVVGELNPAALLSGTPPKDRSKKARGGLLREIPATGSILCVKDLGAILAMPNERRVGTLQALRDVYDGRYTRDVGAGGGEHLEWTGRLGLLAGATGELDRHHAVIGALGERWITLRPTTAAPARWPRSRCVSTTPRGCGPTWRVPLATTSSEPSRHS